VGKEHSSHFNSFILHQHSHAKMIQFRNYANKVGDKHMRKELRDAALANLSDSLFSDM
jgi:hypothetical protein